MDFLEGRSDGVSGYLFRSRRDCDDSVDSRITEKQGYKGKKKAEILKEEKEIAFSRYSKAEKHEEAEEDYSYAKKQPGKHKALAEIFNNKGSSGAEG